MLLEIHTYKYLLNMQGRRKDSEREKNILFAIYFTYCFSRYIANILIKYVKRGEKKRTYS